MTKLTVLSFGGGVQSTVLALMASKREIERPDVVIFADTGNETQATYHHIWRVFEALVEAGIHCEIVSAGNIADDVLYAAGENGVRVGRIGQPPFYVNGKALETGKLWRKCSSEYKIKPQEKRVRELLGVPPGKKVPKEYAVEKWMGITVDEASRMKPSRLHYETTRWPLIEKGMTRWDCHIWLKKAGWGVVPKSSCKICPFHDNAYWRELRDNSPEEFNEVIEWEKQMHDGRIPGTNSPAYIHRACEPLGIVDIADDVERGQYTLNLWGGECEGICGT